MLDVRDLTIIITHWMRDDDLGKCLASIHNHLSGVRILTQDTGGNLSWGRNQLMKRVKTPYVFLMEEDMRWGPRVDLHAMARLLDTPYKGVDPLMCSLQLSTGRRTVSVAARFRKTRLVDSKRAVRLFDGTRALVAEYAANAWLAKTNMVRTFRWNEELPMGEHEDYFWRIKQELGDPLVYVHDGVMEHLGSRPTEEYTKQRLEKAYAGLKHAAKLNGSKFVFSRSFRAWQGFEKKRVRPRLIQKDVKIDVNEDVTFCITHYLRHRDVADCIKSIRRNFPYARVLTENTRGNLSRARNALLSRCTTPYYFMIEEDMRLFRNDDLSQLIDVMESNPTLIGATSCCLRSRIRTGCAGTYRDKRDMAIVANARNVKRTEKGSLYIPCWHSYNVGLFRTSVLKKYRWDESYPMGEHYDFTYRVFKDHMHPFACTTHLVRHKISRNDEYDLARRTAIRIGRRRFRRVHGKHLRGTKQWTAMQEFARVDKVQRDPVRDRLAKHRQHLMKKRNVVG